MSWQTVLGFEVHVELGTNSKMFCGCPADHFGKPPNSQVCPVCLGLPGALPVPNRKAIEWTVKLGLALDCQINLFSKFDRKNYFYPDLPKGYQISQYDLPFCFRGNIKLPSGKTIRITRVHLEEDTGKLQHSGSETLIDFNRSSVPLVEIVTEPDFDNPEEGIEFLKEIQQIVRTLGISTADMEKGSMRLEANVSVRQKSEGKDQKLPDYKVEIKNVNSFRFIKKAIEFDVARQISILESGKTPAQETRGFKENLGETVSQRTKEDAHDYRYFPDPDIPPIEFTREQIETWRKELPELPNQTRDRLISLGVPPATSTTLIFFPERLAKYTELAKSHDPVQVAKLVANVSEDKLATLEFGKENSSVDPEKIKEVVKNVISQNPKAVADIKAGKQQVMFYLIGQVKKELGEVDIELTKQAINEHL